MSAGQPDHAADPTVVLVDDEVALARSAVREMLRKIATKYRMAVRRNEPERAKNRLEYFDRMLDLYERLGGNPDTVPDPEDQDTDLRTGTDQ